LALIIAKIITFEENKRLKVLNS